MKSRVVELPWLVYAMRAASTASVMKLNSSRKHKVPHTIKQAHSRIRYLLVSYIPHTYIH